MKIIKLEHLHFIPEPSVLKLRDYYFERNRLEPIILTFSKLTRFHLSSRVIIKDIYGRQIDQGTRAHVSPLILIDCFLIEIIGDVYHLW